MRELLNQPTFWGSLLISVVTLLGLLANRATNSANTIQTQGKTLSDAFDEISELREEIKKADKRNKITWGYMITLVESYRFHNIVPPDPPLELQTDPELMRLIKSIKNSSVK